MNFPVKSSIDSAAPIEAALDIPVVNGLDILFSVIACITVPQIANKKPAIVAKITLASLKSKKTTISLGDKGSVFLKDKFLKIVTNTLFKFISAIPLKIDI